MRRKYAAKVMLSRAGLRSLAAFTGKAPKSAEVTIRPDDPDFVAYKKKIEESEKSLYTKSKEDIDEFKTDKVPNFKIQPDQTNVLKQQLVSMSNSKGDSSSLGRANGSLEEGGAASKQQSVTSKQGATLLVPPISASVSAAGSSGPRQRNQLKPLQMNQFNTISGGGHVHKDLDESSHNSDFDENQSFKPSTLFNQLTYGLHKLYKEDKRTFDFIRSNCEYMDSEREYINENSLQLGKVSDRPRPGHAGATSKLGSVTDMQMSPSQLSFQYVPAGYQSPHFLDQRDSQTLRVHPPSQMDVIVRNNSKTSSKNGAGIKIPFPTKIRGSPSQKVLHMEHDYEMQQAKPTLGVKSVHQRSNSNISGPKKVTIEQIDYDSVAAMSSITNPQESKGRPRRTLPQRSNQNGRR